MPHALAPAQQADDLVMNRGAAFRQKRMMLTLLEEARRRVRVHVAPACRELR
jgi:hypothetical protein